MIQSLALDHLTIFADDESRPGLDILQNGFNYERHVVAEIRRLATAPNATGFLDIGANIGVHTLIAKHANPLLPVVCAECSDFNLQLLCRNIRHNALTEVTVLPFALADRPRIITTNTHGPNMCCSSDPAATDGYPRYTAALPLDHLRLPEISFIKADIEGFELLALRGASRLLRTHPPIIFEYCPELTHRSSNATPIEFLQWFLDQGYQLTVLDYLQNGMRADFTDAVKCHAHVQATSKWIADLLATPLDIPATGVAH